MRRTETDCGETILTVHGATYVDDIGKCLVGISPLASRAGEMLEYLGVVGEATGRNELSEMTLDCFQQTGETCRQ